jgi:hypothetical protein
MLDAIKDMLKRFGACRCPIRPIRPICPIPGTDN